MGDRTGGATAQAGVLDRVLHCRRVRLVGAAGAALVLAIGVPAWALGNRPPAARLGPVATALGCPDGTARFGADGTATVGTARYDLALPTQRDVPGHWVELSGRRVLVARVNCTHPGSSGTAAVAVFAPDGHGGLTGIDAVRIDGDAGTAWNFQVRGGTLTVLLPDMAPVGTGVEYRWNGSYFSRTR